MPQVKNIFGDLYTFALIEHSMISIRHYTNNDTLPLFNNLPSSRSFVRLGKVVHLPQSFSK